MIMTVNGDNMNKIFLIFFLALPSFSLSCMDNTPTQTEYTNIDYFSQVPQEIKQVIFAFLVQECMQCDQLKNLYQTLIKVNRSFNCAVKSEQLVKKFINRNREVMPPKFYMPLEELPRSIMLEILCQTGASRKQLANLALVNRTFSEEVNYIRTHLFPSND